MIRGRVARGIAHVAGGSAGAQAVAFLTSLVVARHVAPHAYGVFAAVTAIATVSGTVATLRLELAVPVPEDDAEADRVVRAAYTITLVTAVVEALAVLTASRPLAGLIGVGPADARLLWFVPALTAGIGAFAALMQRSLRDRQYGRVATRSLLQALVTAVAQIGLARVWPTAASLLIGVLLGQVTAVLFLLRRGMPRLPADWSLTRRVLTAYRSFPAFLAPSALVNALGLQAPLLLGGALFGAAFAGWFGMAQRLVAVPVTVLGAAVGQVFLGEFSTLRRTAPQAVGPAFDRASRALTAAAILTALALGLLGPVVIPWVLGTRYAVAGTYAQALCLGVAGQVVAAPLSSALAVTGHQAWQAAWDVSRLVVTALVFWSGSAAGLGPTGTLWVYGGTSVVLYAMLWFATRAAVHEDSGGRAHSSLAPSRLGSPT